MTSLPDALQAFRDGEVARARALLDTLDAQDELGPHGLLLLALVQRREEAGTDDLLTVQRAVDAAPDDATVLLRAARTAGWGAGFGLGASPRSAAHPPDLALASALVERALTLAPDEVAAWTTAYDVAERLGRQHAALDALTRAVALAPDDEDLRLRLVDTLIGLRDPEQALAHARTGTGPALRDRTAELAAELQTPDAVEAALAAHASAPDRWPLAAARLVRAGD
ncbi:MAG: hypothetical protein H6732_18960, partial [Alphaproteobacteria bacterium]|nr:hypothetical protein [Alphaproteobacteria bacterium]